MGRRALKKIDPHLDLSRWLLTEEDLPEWIPDESVFGRAAPLEIEVGSGKGMFLAYATQAYHDHDFLGIEIAQVRPVCRRGVGPARVSQRSAS